MPFQFDQHKAVSNVTDGLLSQDTSGIYLKIQEDIVLKLKSVSTHAKDLCILPTSLFGQHMHVDRAV